MASEVQALSISEREQLVKFVAGAIGGRVPFIVGASADDAEICRSFAKLAEKVNAAAYLVAVPNALYGRTEELLSFFRSIVVASSAPIIIQDLQWNGPALDLESTPAVCRKSYQRSPDSDRDVLRRAQSTQEFARRSARICIFLAAGRFRS